MARVNYCVPTVFGYIYVFQPRVDLVSRRFSKTACCPDEAMVRVDSRASKDSQTDRLRCLAVDTQHFLRRWFPKLVEHLVQIFNPPAEFLKEKPSFGQLVVPKNLGMKRYLETICHGRGGEEENCFVALEVGLICRGALFVPTVANRA